MYVADVWTANTDNVMETGWSKKIERQTLRSIENNPLKRSYKQNQSTCGFTAWQPNRLLVTGRAMNYDWDMWCKSDERRDTRSCRVKKGLKPKHTLTWCHVTELHDKHESGATTALRLLPRSVLTQLYINVMVLLRRDRASRLRRYLASGVWGCISRGSYFTISTFMKMFSVPN